MFRLKGHVAGSITLALSILVAIFAFQMPVDMAFAAAGYGFLYGLWPIAWIIVAAVFLYKLTVKSGQFEVIRSSVLSITDDQRLQVLLIGFCFGAFLEGAAGFGAPVAITAALLVGLGFNPLYAAGLCLIANTAPVAFGALGIPIIVAGQVTGIDAFHIGAMTGRQLPLLSLFVPFWLVFMMDGLRGVKETWPAALVAGLSFAVTQYFTSNFIGPELPDITSAPGQPDRPDPVPESLAAKAFVRRSQGQRRCRRGPAKRQPAKPLQLWRDLQGLVAVPDPHRAGHHLDPETVQGGLRPGRRDVQLRVQLRYPAPRPTGDQVRTDRRRANRHASGVQARPDLCHRHRDLPLGADLHGRAEDQLQNWSDHFQGNLLGAALANPVDRHGAGLRLRHQLLGHVLDHGVGAGRYRCRVPVLLAVPRLAGCVPDRFRHLVQRPVQLTAGHYRAPDRGQRHSAGSGQHQRRRDRQDDLAAVDRRGLRRHRPGWQGIRPVPLHRQAQPVLRHHRRPDHSDPGLLADRHAGSSLK
ncbi:L-lactate transport [Pseudomonas putida S11]|nr:L-lactate transport [Pseudomonas putida S11]